MEKKLKSNLGKLSDLGLKDIIKGSKKASEGMTEAELERKRKALKELRKGN